MKVTEERVDTGFINEDDEHAGDQEQENEAAQVDDEGDQS